VLLWPTAQWRPDSRADLVGHYPSSQPLGSHSLFGWGLLFVSTIHCQHSKCLGPPGVRAPVRQKQLQAAKISRAAVVYRVVRSDSLELSACLLGDAIDDGGATCCSRCEEREILKASREERAPLECSGSVSQAKERVRCGFHGPVASCDDRTDTRKKIKKPRSAMR